MSFDQRHGLVQKFTVGGTDGQFGFLLRFRVRAGGCFALPFVTVAPFYEMLYAKQ